MESTEVLLDPGWIFFDKAREYANFGKDMKIVAAFPAQAESGVNQPSLRG